MVVVDVDAVELRLLLLLLLAERCARATARSDRVSENGSLSGAALLLLVAPVMQDPASAGVVPAPAPLPTPVIAPQRLSPALRPNLSRTLGSASCLATEQQQRRAVSADVVRAE